MNNENENGTEFKAINTQEELNAIIENKLQEQKASLKSEMEKTLATERKRYEENSKKEIERAKMTAEERAKDIEREVREQEKIERDNLIKEVEQLKKANRDNLINSKLLEFNLPKRYLNDTRLINSENLDKTIQDLKNEYELEKKDILRSNIHNTNPNTTNTTSNTTSEGKDIDAFKKALGL